MSTLPPPPSAERSPLRKITGNEDLRKTGSATKRLKVDTTTQTRTPIAAVSAAPWTITYPEHVDIPSKSLIKSLFEQAETSGNGDQKSLTAAGLLSLEEVLLPAIAYQEDQALRHVQAKAQRDGPPQAVACIETCRKAVFDGIRHARQAVAQSRQDRFPAEQQRQAAWAQEKQRQRQARHEQAQRLAAQQEQERNWQRQQRKNELIKTWPRNQAMWREVVDLMNDLAKLQKEERLWKEAREQLQLQQDEIAAREEQKRRQEAERNASAAVHENNDISTNNEPQPQKAGHDMEKVQQAVQDMTLSTVRIQQALGIVSDIAKESDQVRKELYRRYRKDHQFHGYQGVQDAKGLLRVLSQSQDVE